MITQCYTVYDVKAAVYGTPFFALNDSSAIRLFSDLVNDVRSSVSRHPEDYSLWHIGCYSDDVAGLESRAPRNMVIAAALVKAPDVRQLVIPGTGDVVRELARAGVNGDAQ